MTNATGALLAPVDAGHTSGHSSAPPRDGARVRGPQLRWSALVALGVLLAQLAATVRSPAGAESLSSLRARREAARSRHAQLASQIDVMRASDAQLMSAVQSLIKEVDVQAASVDAARLALRAAMVAADAAGARLSATRGRIAVLRGAVIQRAVSEYVEPASASAFSELVSSRNLDDATRRRQLMSEVDGRSLDVLDELHAARDDLVVEQAELNKAQALASDRRRAAEAHLADLGGALAGKDRLASALHDRITAFQAEADAVAAQDANLSSLIRARQVPVYVFPGGGGSVAGKVSGAGLMWPASGPITSPFGYRWGRLHSGIDIGAPYGAPIRAAKAGHVIFSGQMRGYGNVVVVDHGGGFSTLYAHESSLVAGDGADVAQGQLIGYCGATGDATGPHLHFETRVNATPEDPMRYLP